MSHEIEQYTDENGTVTSFAAYAIKPAWHQLGYTSDGLMTGKELLVNAHLGGWNVRKASSFARLPADPQFPQLEGQRFIEVPGCYTIVRDHPITGEPEAYRSSVGEKFTEISNEEVVDFGDTAVHESKGTAHWDTGGALFGGSKVFAMLRFGQDILIGGEDPLRCGLALITSHDGHGALHSLTTNIRVVCANTERAAQMEGGHKAKYSIRHTQKAQERIVEARTALQLSWKYSEALAGEFERMIQTPASDAWFADHVVRTIFPAPKVGAHAGALTLHKEREELLLSLWDDTTMVTPKGTSIKGTRWGAYNAVTLWADHRSRVAKTVKNPEAARATRVLAGGMDDFKEQAFALCRVG